MVGCKKMGTFASLIASIIPWASAALSSTTSRPNSFFKRRAAEMSKARSACTMSGRSPEAMSSNISSRRFRNTVVSSLSARFSSRSSAAIMAWRNMATALDRFPGELPDRCAPSPKVALTPQHVWTRSSCSPRPAVFTMQVCPEISSPGECPVCTVVTPKPRTHSTKRSFQL